MSEVALFLDPKAVIPAHLKQGVDDLTKSLMGGSLGSKKISVRGSVFRMIVDGQEIAKNEDRSMDVVIVNGAEFTSRTYFSGVYQEGQNVGPDCWSNDGKTPDARAENPQGVSCASCPMNIAGSGQGTSRACRYSRRLAVVMANDIESSAVYQLVLSAQSIFGKSADGKMPFEQYVRFLGGHNLSIRSVVTRMSFDTNSATPKLTFRAVSPLAENDYLVAVDKGNSYEAANAITYNPLPSNREKDKPAPVEAKKAEKPEPVFIEEAPAPTVRDKKAAPVTKDLDSVLEAWGDDE
jgi:hypothetical protein